LIQFVDFLTTVMGAGLSLSSNVRRGFVDNLKTEILEEVEVNRFIVLAANILR
jgi:hypothetical protein